MTFRGMGLKTDLVWDNAPQGSVAMWQVGTHYGKGSVQCIANKGHLMQMKSLTSSLQAAPEEQVDEVRRDAETTQSPCRLISPG